MGRIGGRRKVLEPDVMRDIIADSAADDLANRRSRAAGGAVVVDGLQVETTDKRTPRDIGGVEQIADVLGCRHALGRWARAGVAGRIDIADQRETTGAVGEQIRAAGTLCLSKAVGLAGEHVDRAGRRRTVLVTPGIVAHRVVLGVVPQSGDRVAVEIAHHLASWCRKRRRRRWCRCRYSTGTGRSCRRHRPSARACRNGPGQPCWPGCDRGGTGW